MGLSSYSGFPFLFFFLSFSHATLLSAFFSRIVHSASRDDDNDDDNCTITWKPLGMHSMYVYCAPSNLCHHSTYHREIRHYEERWGPVKLAEVGGPTPRVAERSRLVTDPSTRTA